MATGSQNQVLPFTESIARQTCAGIIGARFGSERSDPKNPGEEESHVSMWERGRQGRGRGRAARAVGAGLAEMSDEFDPSVYARRM